MKALYLIVSTLAGISIVVRDLQLWKPSTVLSCDPFSNVTVCREVQPAKAPPSIVSTLAGISIEVNAVQFAKALPLIVLSCDPFSNVTVCREVQNQKALYPIVSTLAGISIVVRDVQLWKTPPHPELFSNALSCDPFSNVTVCREVQRLKVPLPIVFTPAGIEIETNEEPQKACVPIAVSVLGRVTLLILVHFKNASVGKTERFTLEISRCSKL